jgi:iron complex outermembrane receptor protein
MSKKLQYPISKSRLFSILTASRNFHISTTVLSIICLLLHTSINAQKGYSPGELKKLSVEELMNIEVTLVSRTPEKLTEAASAIQVITSESIRRSGATNIPEALRLATNLQVARITATAWIISARGFNTIFANKLLVMIDGRTVYTPLFGGVIWELQNVLLEDVERIEVVSGPGGTLWGANAVNGIINIITRSSKDTKGLYASVAKGNLLTDMAELRYGGALGKKASFRVYGQHFDRKATKQTDGTENGDAIGMTQSGFRVDWDASAKNAIVFQGDLYDGKRKSTAGNSNLNGQNILGRWSHKISDKSGLELQAYVDRYFRDDVQFQSSDEMVTMDLDFQHHFPLPHQNILWGAGYRIVNDEALFTTTSVGILPPKKTLHLFSGFVQDEINLSKKVKLTAGTKVTHYTYSGLEWQPSVRIGWNPNSKSILWSAVSKAVRSASRYDVDYFLPAYPVPSTTPSVSGGPNFVSEKVTAYELGYRLQPNAKTSFSAATFYNVYDDLYSVEALPGSVTYHIENGSEGESWGAEFSGLFQFSDAWRLRGGYTYFNKELRSKPGHNFDPTYLGNDARSNAVLMSMLTISKNLQFDITARYLDEIPKSLATELVPACFTFDARLGVQLKPFELSVTGQNLFKKEHTEFGTIIFPRSVYAKLSCRF